MEGLTIIIVAFKRQDALIDLLKSIRKQIFGLPIELFLINNDNKHPISRKITSPIGREVLKFKDIKIFNTDNKYSCSIRYYAATLAKYQKILMLDDDIVLTSNNFIKKMYDTSLKYRDKDIVSCWCAKINNKEDQVYTSATLINFKEEHEEQEVDLIGPGVCIYDKNLLSPELIAVPLEYRHIDNIWFSIMPSVLYGTRKYYMPSHGMLRFNLEAANTGLYVQEGMNDVKNKVTKSLMSKGYTPLFMRK